MSARRWPGSSRDATRTAEPVVLAPAPVPSGWTLEEAEEEERKLGDGHRLASRERDDARAALEAARATLPGAASRGFEAAREAQRTISEAEERLRAAESVTSAMEAALRPVAEERWRLAKIKLREDADAALEAKLRERAAVDAEIVAALDALARLAARRDEMTAAASRICESATSGGADPLPGFERSYYGSPVREAAALIPGSLRHTLST